MSLPMYKKTFNANFPKLCHHQLLLVPHYLTGVCMESRNITKPAFTVPSLKVVSEKANEERELVSWWGEPLGSGLLQSEHYLKSQGKWKGKKKKKNE